MLFFQYYLTTLVLVSSEVITLIKDNNITCVLTNNSVHSAVYIKNCENCLIYRTHQEITKWLDSDWILSNSVENFDVITDKRWMDFNFSSSFPDNTSTSFSVCLKNDSLTSLVSISNRIKELSNPGIIFFKSILTHFSNNHPENKLATQTFIRRDFCDWKHLRKSDKAFMYGGRTFDIEPQLLSKFKVHEYDYWYSTRASSYKSSINVGSNKCVSMYVSIDKGCYLNITLESDNEVLQYKTIHGLNNINELKQWTRIQIESDNEREKNISFVRGTHHSTIRGYWAIDEINNCLPKIVTYNTLISTNVKSNYFCEVFDPAIKVSNTNKSNCPSPYIGQHCNITCGQILGNAYAYCEGHQICSGSHCYCSWGYRGLHCNQACKTNHWGINCEEKCNEKCKGCNGINGTCAQFERQNYSDGCSESLCVNVRNHSIVLTWNQPIQTVTNYVIFYECHGHFCSNSTESFGDLLILNNTIFKTTINQHRPFSTCTVKLYGKINESTFLIDQHTTTLNSEKSISTNELPKSLILTPNTGSLELDECVHFRGPINYTITFTCLSKWCHEKDVKKFNYEMKTYSPYILDLELQPYTSYDVYVVAKRLGQEEKRKFFSKVVTPSSRPYSVENLSVYRYSNQILWIKWMEHYPPSGRIETHNITIQNDRFSFIAFSNSTFSCKIWKSYQCANVSYSNYPTAAHYLSVSSKNYDVEEYSPQKVIRILKTIQTSAPTNLLIKSKSEKNILTWMYPFFTYGKPLEKFMVTVNENSPISINITNEETYNQTILVEYGKQYTISIWAKNEFDGEKANISILVSYPVKGFSSSPFIISCFKTCNLTLPEPAKQKLSFKIIRSNAIDEIICVRNSKDIDIPCELGKKSTDSYSLYLMHDGSKIPLKFSIEETVQSHVIILVLLVIVIAFAAFIYYQHCRLKSKRNSTKEPEHIKMCEKSKIGRKQSETFLSKSGETLENSYNKLPISTAIKINQLEDYLSIEDHVYDNEIVQQFQSVPKIKSVPCRIGLTVANSTKNRYKNVIPYDHSRVVLRLNPERNYINASYIDGYNTKKAFISTQTPLKTTVHDFWTMIFQENVDVIVMLDEIGDNFMQYWPEHKLKFGAFVTECISMKLTTDYTHREIQLNFDGHTRLIQHFQCTTWPDGGMPLSYQSFIALLKSVQKTTRDAPVVVHSNAGCGKTGTYILCDIAMKMATKKKMVDFYGILDKLRDQRPNMVTRLEQYMFAHFLISAYLNENEN